MKLTPKQREVLNEIAERASKNMPPFYCVDSYPPAQKLIELGLITRDDENGKCYLTAQGLIEVV